jgi:hypothetical protein
MTAPDLGPTPEAAERGGEPADALYIDRGWPPDAPEPPDPLDFDLPEGVRPGSEADPLSGLIDLHEPPAEVWTEIHFEAEAETGPERELEAGI